MKKLLSILLAVMLLATLAVTAFAADEETFDTWDGSASTTPEQLNGVYQIDSAADLVGFAALVNSGNNSGIDAVLLTNIDLGGYSFTPIGAHAYKDGQSVENPRYVYSGSFNGNNHTIRNGSISSASDVYNMGIFGFVEEGTISNLKAVDIKVNSTKTTNESSSGVMIGILYKGTATNLIVGEDCEVAGVYRVGGVIGSARDACMISYCSSAATVTGSGMYTGGIVGAAHDIDYLGFLLTGDPATINNCTNTGTVSGNTEVGGIVGYTDQTNLNYCTNSGNVSADGNYGTGGIVGFDAYNAKYLLGMTVYEPDAGAQIKHCTNSGTISGGRAGGILGTLGATPGDHQPDDDKVMTNIENCTNNGVVSGTAGKCGAIFGRQVTYALGDEQGDVENLLVRVVGNTIGVNVTVNGAAPNGSPTETGYYVEQ